MKEGKFRRLPIVNQDGKLVGIVTESDVSEALHTYANEIKPKVEHLTLADKTIVQQVLQKHYPLEAKKSYLLLEEKPKEIYDVFLSLLSQGYAGLAITRQHPDFIKHQYGLEETIFLWLTNMQGPDTIRPTDLEKMMFTITTFIANAEKTVILLDGVEYLINYTSFQEVLHLLQSVVDRVSISNAIFLVSLDPATIEPKEQRLISRSLEVLTPVHAITSPQQPVSQPAPGPVASSSVSLSSFTQ